MASLLTVATLSNHYSEHLFEIALTGTLVYAGCFCTLCNEQICTHDKHDIGKCKCSNEVRILGGLSNPQVFAKNTKYVHPVMIYDNEDYVLVRKFATRGYRGKLMDQPLTYVTLKNLPCSELERGIIMGGPSWHLNLLTKEIQYRFTYKFKILDDGATETREET